MGNDELAQRIRKRVESADLVRRGVCLINAGRYDEASQVLTTAVEAGCTDRSIPAFLTACLVGQDRPDEATERLSNHVRKDPSNIAARIRRALLLLSAGRGDEAIQTLRDGMKAAPECSELHFQLGLLLASREQYEEAELRFTQALSIDADHTEARVNLALCRGAAGAPSDALSHLQQAQASRPFDARIAFLLASAAKAVRQEGYSVRVRASMPEDDTFEDDRGIESLSRVIEKDPEFVDAFLSVRAGDVDERVFATLLRTLHVALARRPEHAELHFHCGRVLSRLGRTKDAIKQNEQAIRIDPKFVQALIELANLYRQTDRGADATTRLEQAIATGVEYADVYYLLGSLYREQGRLGRARTAYKSALKLNDRYEAASRALEALPVS